MQLKHSHYNVTVVIVSYIHNDFRECNSFRFIDNEKLFVIIAGNQYQ